jgi:catechol 2,3-dioxygenase-like lactoylglutathione lyase family enzyme
MLRRMFDHVALRCTDFAASARAYRRLLGVLGAAPSSDEDDLLEWEDFDLSPVDAEHPATENAHVGLLAPSPDAAEAFWRAGVEAGLRDDGAPGPRPIYGEGYFGAFLRDFDGNSIEACRHPNSVDRGVVDHVWMRVSDLDAARAFYETVAPYTGFTVGSVEPGHVQFRGPAASFSLVAGAAVTRNLHLAFPADDDDTVAAFHLAAVAAGHPDNGPPGERPEYHPGYVGAFVLDPDGNNIEVVNHNR